MDNAVNFVQTSLLDGIIDKIKKKKEKKANSRSNSSGSLNSSSGSSSGEEIVIDEKDLKEAEANMSPDEKKRLDLKHQKEGLPMFTYRDELLAAIRDN